MIFVYKGNPDCIYGNQRGYIQFLRHSPIKNFLGRYEYIISHFKLFVKNDTWKYPNIAIRVIKKSGCIFFLDIAYILFNIS